MWRWLNARGLAHVVLMTDWGDGKEYPVAIFVRRKSAEAYAEEWNSCQRETGGFDFERVESVPFWWFR